MSWLTGPEVSMAVYDGRIKIDPFDPEQVNPNSYDYRLAPTLRILETNGVFDNGFEMPYMGLGKAKCLDPRQPMKYREVTIPEKGFLLVPDMCYLGHTVEKLGSDVYASLVTGKSSIGRLFVDNHVCAGLVDQGFYDHITLEITCRMPTVVYPNMRFGQIFWFQTLGDRQLYAGKYSRGDNAAAPSRVGEDVDR